MLAVLTASVANAERLDPGQILEARFDTTGVSCPGGPCGTLMVDFLSYGSWYVSDISADLYDGATLLGSFTGGTYNALPIFRSPSSLASTFWPTADLASLVAGSKNGVIDITLASGYFTFPESPQVRVTLARADAPGLFVANDSVPASVKILDARSGVAPEPVTGVLLGVGLVVLIGAHAVGKCRKARLN
jgi:hypothetical protein